MDFFNVCFFRFFFFFQLGHFFGNRVHPETPGNIMSYNRGDDVPFFDEDQIDRIHMFTRRFLRTRELLPIARLRR